MKPLWERGVQRCLFRLCRGHLFRCFPFCMVSTELLEPCFGVVARWIMREVAFLAPAALARWHPVKVVPVIASEFQADGVACFVDEGMQPCPCRRIRAAAWVSSSCCCVFFIHIIHWRDKVICVLLLLIRNNTREVISSTFHAHGCIHVVAFKKTVDKPFDVYNSFCA